jgi:hypothetical protein
MRGRAGLVLGWVTASYSEEWHLIADVERIGLGDLSKQRRDLETRRPKLAGYVNRHRLRLRPLAISTPSAIASTGMQTSART